MKLRPLGNTDIRVSAVALGCWPIAGMTSPGVNDEDGLATIRACFELGIHHLDTAYCYGPIKFPQSNLPSRECRNPLHIRGGSAWRGLVVVYGFLAWRARCTDTW